MFLIHNSINQADLLASALVDVHRLNGKWYTESQEALAHTLFLKILETDINFSTHPPIQADNVANQLNSTNEKKELIYISRSIIPGSKKNILKNSFYHKQVCIYAFTKKELDLFYRLKKKSKLEKTEDIEILRFFELNRKIKMVKTQSVSLAVDEKKDIKIIEKYLNL